MHTSSCGIEGTNTTGLPVNMTVADICQLQVEVACTQDVLNVMEIGQRNRSVAETKMNERSSRSHSVLTIIVDGLNNVTGIRTHGCLHLIDLAGKLNELPQTRKIGMSEMFVQLHNVECVHAVCSVCLPEPSMNCLLT